MGEREAYREIYLVIYTREAYREVYLVIYTTRVYREATHPGIYTPVLPWVHPVYTRPYHQHSMYAGNGGCAEKKPWAQTCEKQWV